ncbi:MAG TPA: helix-turn-helix transcriptional regulator [Longimicrobium sp.]
MARLTSGGLADARRRIGWSREQLADSLNVPVDRVREWETDRVPIPRRTAREVEGRLAWAEYEAGVRKAGIPVCEWAEAWDATPFPEDDEGMLKSLDELRAHEEACPVCTARRRYAELHPPPVERPTHILLPVIWILDQLHRVPERPRPIVWGALAGCVAVLAPFFRALGDAPSVHRLTDALLVLGAGIVTGAAGGAAYVVARPLCARLRRGGRYVLGVVCTATAMGVALALSRMAGRTLPRGADEWALAGAATLVLGLCVGYGLSRPGGPE